jgi:hypothetical protein
LKNALAPEAVSLRVSQERMEMEVESYLRRRYEGQIADVVKVEKEDLDLVRSPLSCQKQGCA